MEYKDYYQTLGVSRTASAEDIKKAYRRLVRKYHPDVSKEKDAEQKIKEINEAHEVLQDADKRAAYDQLGAQWKAGQEFNPPPDWNFTGGFGGNSSTVDFGDFFENIFNTRNAKRGRTQSHFRMQGEDQHAQLSITLEEAYQGTTRSVQIQIPEMDAQGHTQNKTRTLNVKVPVGISSGQKIRLAGQGSAGMGGGTNGDLYLEINLQPHAIYRVEGHDIYLTLPITPWEAALGATVAVPTLGGNVDLKIPMDSQSGQKLRLRGRGLAGKPAGDQYVVLQIVTPRAETEQARQFYQKMAETFPFDPRKDLLGA
ncbi:DnaJ C-terminal domain-containing protein [Beggiatoa leptomitoformis]|uniref:DnaJ domain-containing protein n=1 Tax=Beggiatoa leptomitoformis TaxID=288004 RepID=A0A2N9YBI8_9GAMM|nr:DnaJ C-terminal domain-containing protein [Beggiatoa leptomitoformis]ALG66802.1 DnaJ domain-containing protein [Beggiatoa leptomitoformis]AUI67850.1 DnaJ domain-containing protein [Beggiatoa leptomitoformis]